MSDFTHEELIAYLESTAAKREPEETPNSVTSREYAEAIGVGRDAARRRLKEMATAGLVRPAMIKRVDMWGRLNTIPGYVLARDK